MIQDIAPQQFDLSYTAQTPSPEDFAVIFQNRQVLLTEKQDYPHCGAIKNAVDADYLFLFSISGRKYYLALLSSELQPETLQLHSIPVRAIRSLRPMYLAFAGFTAWHLASWYENNLFCGHCGGKMEPGADERKLVCASCRREIFPRINPCVIVAVHDGDRLLMTKYANRTVTWFVLIAGFIEIGETAEDTVRREVMEETGVKVKNIRYFGSQPWGVPGNLTLGFTAELDGSDEITLETSELSEGRWFSRDEVPVPDDDVSITSAMIHAFVRHEF